jgi:hypothetical protein
MHGRCVDFFQLWLVAATLLVAATSAHALVIPAKSYDRHYFTEPGAHEEIQSSGELSGGRWGITGWIEYPVDVGAAGWYKLWTHGDAPAGVEFAVDADAQGKAPAERYFYQREYSTGSPTPVGNVWLSAGRHRIRLTRYFWTGFPKVSALELRPAGTGLDAAVHVFFRQDQQVFRKGECPELVAYGGATARGSLEIVDAGSDGSRYGRYHVSFTTSAAPVAHAVRLACSEAGFHHLSWRFDGLPASADAQPPLTFQIIDTEVMPPAIKATSRPPLVDIDCATQEPDYAAASGTRISSLANSRYRESGDTGWIPYQRYAAAERGRHPAPAWFAYVLRGVLPQQRYRVDVDYPDDAARTFAVAWRESTPLQYPVASAVETGREYRLSVAPQTLTFHVWARATGPRLTFLPAHDGDRAACLRIRVYLDDAFAGTPAMHSTNTRQFLNWYEEGEHFTSLFGPATEDAQGFNVAVERWLQHATDMGVSTLVPTASIYSFGMYPSRFNQSFSEPRRDTLRVLLLQAERFGMHVIPELHPRADELAYARNGQRNLGNLAVSRAGKDNFTGPSGRNAPPYFNALDPANQQWYIGMVHELAERYRDSPAFQGISLRYMPWANAALNNLVDLDWGYDDTTTGLYRAETGSKLPVGAHDATRFQRRHDWLLANEREAWIRWRCTQLTRLFTRIRDAARAARPDLQVYLHLFGPSVSTAEVFRSTLKEAGLDLAALEKIDGLVIMNSTFTYGRLEQDGVFFNASRDPLLDPAAMGASPDGSRNHWLVPTSLYLEAIGDVVVPPPQLGFPASTKAAWMSAASNAPGRQALERFALLLAQTDSLALGDGGNNYTLGPPVVAEFAREYRKLPAVPFEQLAGAVDPVTIRSHASVGEFMFYAVNRENYPVQVKIDLSNGETRELELRAYELRVFGAAAGVRITSVAVEIPQAERVRIAERIQWTRGLLAGASGHKPAGGDASVLAQAVAAAQRALDRGLVWQAHSALETSAALRAFRGTGCFPPDMRAEFVSAATCPQYQGAKP